MTAENGVAGLRERKKQLTRQHISNVATELFVRKGFEHTTLADVAEAAAVAKMTVTNYFPLKEDLVFDRAEFVIRLVADGVSRRPAGQSVLDAVRGVYNQMLDEHNPTLGYRGLPFAELIESSPALRAREREIFAEQEAALADVLTAEFAKSATGLAPRIAAAQLAAVFRILYYEARRRLIAKESTASIERALRRAAKTSFDLVEHGLPDRLVRGSDRSPARRQPRLPQRS